MSRHADASPGIVDVAASVGRRSVLASETRYMNVEVLYLDGCPSHEALLPRLRELMAEVDVVAPVRLTRIDSVEAAERERFLGSPTLRVDGEDVDPAAAKRSDFGLKCRLYPGPEGLRGKVPDELVVAALTRAREPRGTGHSAAEVSPADIDAMVLALTGTFPTREDGPLALALVRLLSAGYPASPAALAAATRRGEGEVIDRLDDWPNVERDDQGRVTGFSGLTLQATGHSLRVGDHQLYAWCAWDTLFLPALMNETASVLAKCAVTGAEVQLVVSPRGVQSVRPEELYVTFPPMEDTNTSAIRSSFCCHVAFLGGADAVRRWKDTHARGMVLTLDAAYELGRRKVTALLEPALQPSRS
jgi:alkylmercury lyase